MISVSKFSKLVAGVAALAVAAATFTSVPALAGPPVTPTFTVTNDLTSQPLTDFVATEGTAVDENYTVNFDDTGWNFDSGGSGYGFGGVPDGINYSMTLSETKDSFSLHVFGTPTTGWYQTGVLNVIDSNSVSYSYKFNVKVAALTPTPHIVVNGSDHSYGDVTNLNTSGLFASMPQLYLDRKDSSPLIPITNSKDIYSTTAVADGTTTINYDSDPIYVDPTYGAIRADVILTLTDGIITYSVFTWSEDYEGMQVAAGDIVLKSTLAIDENAATSTLDGGLVSVFKIGKPYVVFDSESNSFDTVSNIATSVSASSDTNHLFRISFYDYTGCPTIAELDSLKTDDLLDNTAYESGSSCAGYPPVFNFSDFGDKNVGDTIAWDASAKYGPYTYTLNSGTLPEGLSLDSTTGAITGTVTVAGDYSFTIKADKTAAFGIQGYFGTISAEAGPAPSISFSAGTVPSGVVGKSYSQPVNVEWGGFTGVQILTITATDGMPAGLTFNAECSEGCSYVLAGTPTTAGTYNVTLTLALADLSSITTTLTIVIYPAEAVIRPVDKTTSISRVVSFAGDSSMLSVAAKASLRKLASLAKSKKMTSVAVTGYTLKTTAAKQSWRSNLGLARAKAIAKYLKALNPKLRIKVSGKGLINKGRIATIKLTR